MFNLLFHPGCKKKKVFRKMAESGDQREDNVVILVILNSLLFKTFISLHFFTLKSFMLILSNHLKILESSKPNLRGIVKILLMLLLL